VVTGIGSAQRQLQIKTLLLADALSHCIDCWYGLQEHCRFIVDVCSGAPVALSVVCNLLRYGHCDAAEFVRLYSDPRLPLDRSLSNTNTSFLPFESRATNERLQRCAGGGTGRAVWCRQRFVLSLQHVC
jgi:hypothetical protein